jgi:hypothetical protein
MSQRTVTSSSLRAALAWLAVFALGYRALGGARWVVAFAVAALVVAALGWRGLLRPLGALSAVLVAVALSASVAAVLLLVGFDLLPVELPRVLAYEKSAVLEPDRTPIEALHHAASVGDLRTVERLLGAGLSPDVVNMSRKGRRGETAIFRAVAGDHLDVAATLLEAGAAIDRCDSRCRTPLNAACANNQLAAAAWLIGHGAKPGHAYREQPLYPCIAQVLSAEEAEWLKATAGQHDWLLPCGEKGLRRLGQEDPPRVCPVEVPRP